MLLLLLLPMALCAYGQTTVTLNLPNPCSTVGMPDPDKSENFGISVFPNPSDNQFSLSIKANEQIGSAVIEIYNAQGVLVYTEVIFSKNRVVIKTISLKNLSDGLYIISVQGKEDRQTENIIINNN